MTAPEEPPTNALQAAATSVDITPDPVEGVFLAGFAPDRTALGLLEPIEAGVLILGFGEQRIALVTVDLIGLGLDIVDHIRDAATAVAPKDIVICATHTHSGPDTLGMWGPAFLGLIPKATGVDPAYIDLLVERISTAIDESAARLEPATLRAASYDVDERWTRNDRSKGGRHDAAVGLAFDALSGERIATLLNYGSHPETLWEKNRQLSPDYPGAFRRRLRELSGGVPLFFQGVLGGMLTPNTPPRATFEGRKDFAEEMGRALADAVVSALDSAEPIPVDSLEHRRREVVVPVNNWRFRIGHRYGILKRTIRDDRTVETEIHTLRLGDVLIVSWPGEPVPELGGRIKAEHMDGEHRLIFSLGCDEMGYILEPAMFDNGDPRWGKHYAYERSMSMGRETAPILVDALDALLSDET